MASNENFNSAVNPRTFSLGYGSFGPDHKDFEPILFYWGEFSLNITIGVGPTFTERDH